MAKFLPRAKPAGCAFIETFAEIHARRARVPTGSDAPHDRLADASERARLLDDPFASFEQYITRLLRQTVSH